MTEITEPLDRAFYDRGLPQKAAPLDLIARALRSLTMLATAEVESERGWFGVVAGSARCLPPME